MNYKISMEEFDRYRVIAIDMFNFMNGRINTINRNCNIEIHIYDPISFKYGELRFPNHIAIFIMNIAESWYDKYESLMSKHDFICTMIAWCIAHELHHADQVMDINQYNTNTEYKTRIEGDVERASHDWVSANRDFLQKIGGFNLCIECLSSTDLPDTGHYKSQDIRGFYLQTILNCIIRDVNGTYNALHHLYNDDVENLVITFNDTDRVLIKRDGRYLEENTGIFSQLVYNYVGMYTNYKLTFLSETINVHGDKLTEIKFNISNPLYCPMAFATDK